MITVVQKYTSHLRSKKLWRSHQATWNGNTVRNIDWAINRNKIEKLYSFRKKKKL